LSYTFPLHDALPICGERIVSPRDTPSFPRFGARRTSVTPRPSTSTSSGFGRRSRGIPPSPPTSSRCVASGTSSSMTDPSGRSSISSRLLVTGGIVAMALVLLRMGAVERSIRSIWLGDLDDHLSELGGVIVAGSGSGDDDALITEVSARTGVRVTLIAPDGLVVADSHEEEAELENHGDRPEVLAALRGEVGHDTRLSESSGFAQRYVALPFPGLVVRVSTPNSVIED